ncbi:pyridoxamine 5'-phosphate oxidase family protein [Pseudactinotalea sp. Z1739]|uniref:pyridoxamine 5'-phosphate oxidase family protein n=1 Tax=Pseudactinotalea sp. Z1739 TaxID=3413028 RepID=UPI003C7E203A
MSQRTEQDESWRGKIGKLDQEELDAFLHTGTIARLACLDGDGWPYIVPCWHEWDGSVFWVVAREKSKWAKFLADNERAAITVDEDGTQRKVVAQCRATIVEEPNLGGQWVSVAERMSLRYLGENGPKYLQPTIDKPRWLIRLDPFTMQTWQGVEWAARYH